MNLRKRISGASDFDVLSSDTGLKIDDSESQGDMLVLGAFYPIVIEILPEEGRIRAKVYLRDVRQVMSFELPLAIAREMSIPLEWSLGILRKQGLEISIPLARTVQQVLDVLMPIHTKPEQIKILVPLKGKPKYEVWFKGTPKNKRKVVATLKALSKLLKGD